LLAAPEVLQGEPHGAGRKGHVGFHPPALRIVRNRLCEPRVRQRQGALATGVIKVCAPLEHNGPIGGERHDRRFAAYPALAPRIAYVVRLLCDTYAAWLHEVVARLRDVEEHERTRALAHEHSL